MIRSAVAVVLSFAPGASFSQQYPVQATTILTPPYSVFLADYVSPDNDNLQLLLFLREVTRPEYRIKLRVKIEGPGVTLTTNPNYVPQPIVISGGVLTTLSGYDIRQYFHPNNLNFSGISKTEFIQTGKLPEGFYTFTIEVIDYGRGTLVSNPSFASAWMILNDPPFVNLPFNNEKVMATDPQNLMFSWTPRHTGSPNAAFNTEYEFRLVEIYPADRNPEDAVRSSNSIFSVTTTLTSLNYSIAEPLLRPGRKYAFRIRAMDISGRDLFKNDGYSETHVFQYGDACVRPESITSEALDAARVKIVWTAATFHTGFRLQYRERTTEDWYEDPVSTDEIIIPDLKANTEYDYKIKGVCGSVHGDYTPIQTIATLEHPIEDIEAMCGTTPPPVVAPSQIPLGRPLVIGDVITWIDSKLKITELSQRSDKTYNGKAIWLDLGFMFHHAKANMKFRGIDVDENLRITKGHVATVYNLTTTGITNAPMPAKVQADSTVATDSASVTLPTPGLNIPIDGDIASVIADTVNNKIILTFGDATTQTIEHPEDIAGNVTNATITDSNGDVWTVDRNGNVTPPSSAQVNPGDLDTFSNLLLTVFDEIKIGNTQAIDSLDQNLQAEKTRLAETLLSIQYDPFLLAGTNSEHLAEGMSLKIQTESDASTSDSRQVQLRIIIQQDSLVLQKRQANRQIDGYMLAANFNAVRDEIKSLIDINLFNTSSPDNQRSILKLQVAEKIQTDYANQ